MKSSIVIASAAALALASPVAAVAPPAPVSPAPTAKTRPAPPVHVTHTAPGKAQPHPAPMPGGMKSNSSSPAMIFIGPSRPPPPIVAIPRIPGPADMMVASGANGDVRTIRSYPSNEACDAALARVRRTISNAFCVSTTPPPPPPPPPGYLVEVEGDKEVVGLTPYPSLVACQKALRTFPKRAGRRALCLDRFH